MSRVPYEVHRARKRAGHSGVGSETPTETEFDFDGTSSLASYSTHVTSSSYRPSSSLSRAFLHEDGDQLRRRTLSPSISQSSRSPSANHTTQFYQNSLLASRQNHVAGYEHHHSESSRSLGPDVAHVKSRSHRPGETDEERRARRERRRAERNATEVEGSRSSAKSGKRAKAKKEKEDEDERRFGSELRDFVRWSVRGGAEGYRWKGLGWGLGGVLTLRLTVLLMIGYRERKSCQQSSPGPLNSSLDSTTPYGILIPLTHSRLMSFAKPTLLSQHRDLLDQTLGLILEMAILWTGLLTWAKIDGKRQSRSWRTQLTGILTILLQPALISSAISDPYITPKLGLAVWALIYFTRSQDARGCAAISLLWASSAHASSFLAGGLGYSLLAKSIWFGGMKGLSYLITMISALLLLPCGIFALGGFISSQSGAETLPGTMAALRETFAAASLARVSGVLQLNWIRYLVMVATQLPTIFILGYTALSTRSTPPQTDSQAVTPTAGDHSHTAISNLLPLALGTSAIPLYLLSLSTPHSDLIFTLLPFTLMLAIRGDDESWDIGVLASNIAIFRMRNSLNSDLGMSLRSLSLLWTVCWNRVIGHSPRRMDSVLLRRFSFMTYVILFSIIIIELIQHTTLPLSLRLLSPPQSAWLHLPKAGSYFSSGVLWVIWGWTMKTLVESAWAMGGFSGLSTGFERTEPQVVIQVIDD